MSHGITHKYSIEWLVHYQCSYCSGWWSIGDGPIEGMVHCPWCGTRYELKPKDEERGTMNDER